MQIEQENEQTFQLIEKHHLKSQLTKIQFLKNEPVIAYSSNNSIQIYRLLPRIELIQSLNSEKIGSMNAEPIDFYYFEDGNSILFSTQKKNIFYQTLDAEAEDKPLAIIQLSKQPVVLFRNI